MSIWIVAAVDSELSLLGAELGQDARGALGACRYSVSHSLGRPIHLGILGIGAVSAASALGAVLACMPVDRMIMVGSGGALPGSGLEVGQVAVASSEILAEAGLCVGAGVGDAKALALPGLEQQIGLDEKLTRRLTESAEICSRVTVGNFLTVMGASGSTAQAEDRARRFSAIVENMEGFSLASAGRSFGVPVAEVRGVSNIAGLRDKSAWRLDLANRRAQETVLEYLRRTC